MQFLWMVVFFQALNRNPGLRNFVLIILVLLVLLSIFIYPVKERA
jgi:hypothetical protein